MSLKKLLTLFAFTAVTATSATFAQEEPKAQEPPTAQEIKDRVDGIDENVTTLLTDVAGLKKLKVSGYMQVQFEKTELYKGFGTSATDKSNTLFSRFKLRRSRIKLNYDAGLTQVVVQGDYSNTGFALKDAYLQITDPWTKLFSLTTGVFNRPVYEVEYSSSQRESPERSAVVKALYPDERDLGAMITYNNEDLFKLQFAAFNNTLNGTFQSNTSNFSEFPLYYMVRLTKSIELADDLVIDLGAHARFGNVPSNSNYFIDADKQKSQKDSTAGKGFPLERTWFGGEMQLYWDFLGGTKLMGEYITGKDADINTSVVATSTTPSPNPVRLRQFSGYYAMLVKNLGFIEELKDFQLAAKYDVYNPNTKLDEEKKEAYADLQKNCFGFGINNFSFDNIRISLWYDMNTTKDVDLSLAKPTDKKADFNYNQLTLRLQYKF